MPAPIAAVHPSCVGEGLRQGLDHANEDFTSGVKVLSNLPQVVRDGYVMLLARSLCLVALKPIRGMLQARHRRLCGDALRTPSLYTLSSMQTKTQTGVFRGWRSVAQGSMTSLDPEMRAEHVVLYKPPRDSLSHTKPPALS